MKLLLIAFNLWFFLMTQPLLAQSYDTEVIKAELYNNTVQRTGKLDYRRTLSLSFKSAGYLAQLNVDEGETFEQGQLLASLNVTELQEEKNSYYAQLTQAKRDVKRINRLMDEKLASERDLDMAMTEVETIRAAYQVAYYNLEQAQIYAPFSGVVLARNTELGELQSPGQAALQVAKLDWVVKVALTGQEISQVQLGQSVKVSILQRGIIEGTISKVPAIANSDDNLFTIEVLLPKTEKRMIAGQLASVNITFENDYFTYRLPMAALVAVDDDGKAIIVTKSMASTEFTQQSFEVFELDNDYVYLRANRNDEPLTVVTQGWQNYSLDGQ